MSIGKRKEQGLVLRYLTRATGYSRQQVTRFMRQCRDRGAFAKRYRPPAHGFACTYTGADVALLAETDGPFPLRHRQLNIPQQRVPGPAHLVLGAMLGGSESARNLHQRPDARTDQD